MTAINNPQHTLPCLFVHGSFAHAGCWQKIIEYLPDHYNSHAVNLPGHGGMPDPDDFENPTFKPEFDVLRSALETIADAKNGIHLIGHSYGGVVALAAAMENTVLIKKLTLFEPVDAAVLSVFSENEALAVVDNFKVIYRQALAQSDAMACAKVIDFWGGAGSFDAVPEHAQAAMATMTKNNARHWTLCIKNIRKIKKYQNLNIPVTLVNGGRSHDVAKIISRSLNNNLPVSDYHLIEKASHFMITSHPQQCADIIGK